MNQIDYTNAVEKYSSNYLKLLKDNLWIQSYLKIPRKWNEYCDGLWLPNLAHLWRLVEAHIPCDPEKKNISQQLARLVQLTKSESTYQVSYKDKKFGGTCPEEALLGLFISLQISSN